MKSFSFANYFCRYCKMHRTETKTATAEAPEKRRNRENYNADVAKRNPAETGVVEFSPLNGIPYFHVCESSAEDITHIVDEGILHYNLLPSLYYFIYEKKYLTLQEFNNRIIRCNLLKMKNKIFWGRFQKTL